MPPSQSRRHFLQLSAAVVAGACGPLSFADRLPRKESSSLAVGLLDSHDNLPELSRAVVANAARVVAVGNSYDKFAETAFDAIVIGHGADAPENAAQAALDNGRHVFSTVPLGRSIKELQALTDLAHRHGVILRTASLSADAASVQQVASLIQSNSLGALREIVCWTSRTDTSDAQRAFQRRGAGVLSVPFLALGARQPGSVYGAGSPTAAGFAEGMAIRYEFPGSGNHTPLHVTWYDGEWAPPYESIDDYQLPASGALYLGDAGQLLDDAVSGIRVLFRNGASPEELPSVASGSHCALTEWLADCSNRSPTAIAPQPCHLVNAAVLAGLASYRVRQSLEWEGLGLCARNCPQADALSNRSRRA